MKPILYPIAALAICATGLEGCAASGGVTVSAGASLQSALAVGCPILNVTQSAGLDLNANQKAAVATLALACPPNAPTTALVAAADLIQAYTMLRPLVTK